MPPAPTAAQCSIVPALNSKPAPLPLSKLALSACLFRRGSTRQSWLERAWLHTNAIIADDSGETDSRYSKGAAATLRFDLMRKRPGAELRKVSHHSGKVAHRGRRMQHLKRLNAASAEGGQCGQASGLARWKRGMALGSDARFDLDDVANLHSPHGQDGCPDAVTAFSVLVPMNALSGLQNLLASPSVALLAVLAVPRTLQRQQGKSLR